MPTDRFLIAPFDSESGLTNNVKPFAIPDQAFAMLNNAYCWRGRIRKRFGSVWLGNTQQLTRLKINVGTTDGGGTGSGTIGGTVTFNGGAIGQMFSIGDNLFTVNQLGTPALLLIDGTASTATFNTTSGAFAFTGTTALTTIYWYPALPVMGLIQLEQDAVNNDSTIAFDTTYSYQYMSTGWEVITAGANIWSGNNAQFFWGATYIGILASDYSLFVTNFNQLEPMRYFLSGSWNNFAPRISATGPTAMVSALIISPFKNRLLAFNVWESNNGGAAVNYPNRWRWSAQGTSPIDNGGAGYYPWLSDIAGQFGGGLDFPVKQNIITIEFIKDRLIVFLDESTWEIVWTGNELQPFVMQQINEELGVESTFSVVPFDKVAIGVGNLGIIACTGANVERIDDKIPDEVFSIHNIDSGVERVYGIRDYFTEMIYWTFPSAKTNSDFPFPNQLLIYNYKNGTWAFNDDSFTVFGYFQSQTGETWDSLVVTWDSDTSWDNVQTSALFKNVIAGNQQGWTFIIDSSEPQNALSLQITDLTIPVAGSNFIKINCIDHNLHGGDYVYFSGITGTGNLTILNGLIFQVADTNPEDPNNFQFLYFDDPPLPTPTIIAGTYTGGGMIARVSQIQLLTKQYNFYQEQGRNAYVSKVDFLVDATSDGEIEVDYYVSTNALSMVDASEPSPEGTGSILGTSILETSPYPTVEFEKFSSQLWHPLYFQADGEFIQLNLQLNDEQMRNPKVRISAFQLHKMIFYAIPSSSRLQ